MQLKIIKQWDVTFGKVTIIKQYDDIIALKIECDEKYCEVWASSGEDEYPEIFANNRTANSEMTIAGIPLKGWRVHSYNVARYDIFITLIK